MEGENRAIVSNGLETIDHSDFIGLHALLREAGLSCRIVTGDTLHEDGSMEYHAWNIVRIDGLYYDLDATWEQNAGGREYFLLADADLPTHTRGAEYADADFCARYPMAEEKYAKE